MRFEVKAVRPGEAVTAVILEADSPQHAEQQLRSEGYAILAVRARGLNAFPARRSQFPLTLFSTELLALLNAGLSLVEALQALSEKQPGSETQQVIEGVLARLNEGKTLSQALAAFPMAFPPFYVATVRATERSGDLPEALARYIAYATQLEAVRKKLLSAAIYPLLVITIGGLVTLFLLGYVVPRFSHIYADLGSELPLLSRVLIRSGEFLESHAKWLGLALILVLIGGVRVFRMPQVRHHLANASWRLPHLGERLRVYQLARLYRTLGMLLKGGIPVVTALGMVEDLLLPNLRARLTKAREAIQQGQPMSVAFARHGLTTPVALRLLRVGERSGEMGEMLENIARFHDEETTGFLERFSRLFEPLLMAMVGGVIGLVVVLLYLPIFELAGSVR